MGSRVQSVTHPRVGLLELLMSVYKQTGLAPIQGDWGGGGTHHTHSLPVCSGLALYTLFLAAQLNSFKAYTVMQTCCLNKPTHMNNA